MTSEYEADQDLYIEYTYDDGGNVTSWYSSEDPSVEPDWGVDFTYEDPQWKDLLTSYDGEEIEYDAIGNPTTYIGSSTLTWTDGRRLATFENSDYSLSFTYDMDGIRQSKTVNGAKTKYFTSGSTILREERSDGKTLYFYYDDLGNIAALEYNNTMYYYVRNILGEILGLANSSGAYVAKYSYTAYGGVLSITDGNGNDVSGNADHIANINPYRYKGYYYDVETGFYYLNSRYYNPMTARFINADGQISGPNGDIRGYNQFAYCFNNPVNMADHNGNWPKWVEKAAKAVAVAAVVVTAAVVVSVATVGTGGLALAAASVAFSTACGGLIGGIANERKGESFVNGWIGGAVNGFVQSTATVLLAPSGLSAVGTTFGGGVGSGLGTAITETLNNKGKPKQEQKSSQDILKSSAKSVAIGTTMSAFTAGLTSMVDFAIYSPMGYNSWTESLNPGVGISPITPGFGELMKGFFNSIDDATVYIFCD